MNLSRACCDDRGPCRRNRILRQAVDHAERRSRKTGRDQSLRWDTDTWLITEAPQRQNGDRT